MADDKIAVTERESVNALISQAITANLPVETMERLFALREKVKAEQAKEAFVSAMAKFQAECPIIEKTKIVKDKTGAERYRYAPLDAIVSQVKKPLGENNLFYSFEEIKDAEFVTAVCKVTHSLGHSETSSFKIPIGAEAFMTDAQKYGARMTFAKRYAFCNALGILTGDEDNDGSDKDEKKIDIASCKQSIEKTINEDQLKQAWKELKADERNSDEVKKIYLDHSKLIKSAQKVDAGQ